VDAVILDFDGLILDTEWAIYETARAAFAAHGHELDVPAWSTIVGINDDGDGWYDSLCATAGIDLDRALFEAAYESQDRSSRDHLLPLPGVVELLDELRSAGIPAAVASSSSEAWLHRHLGRLELVDRFAAIVGADRVGGIGKPAPDVYLRACADVGADPSASVAIEDSAHGVTAAKAAGMAAVAVPSRITIHNDFSHADLVVDSVAAIDVAGLQRLVTPRDPLSAARA
jgi:HAD superfamily hydrolase (TIGR01509 family)